MTNYRRLRSAGACWFFTVNLADRSSPLLVQEITLLRAAFRKVLDAHPLVIDAMVVLPDHLHALWTLPADDGDYSTRWRQIKAAFSRALPMREARNTSRINKGERGIWQRRFWEHQIRDETDYARHVDYIHINPVKHGLVTRAIDWPHTSLHRFVAAGIVARDWASEPDVHGHAFGE
ncbi:MAG: transposase [Xanthomonadaceae bacterium]|nr:transposase [Xanthomonadaceae bacterium]MDP2186675.1 transposase [Xanthomonadales bacterium]MDZ4117343.1 transposase [Xanthomonadaceae bacterium]MDZ4377863.1 transposase [Xanthomonadaceae bacterium]